MGTISAPEHTEKIPAMILQCLLTPDLACTLFSQDGVTGTLWRSWRF